jgi:hypothetical protein
MKHEIAQQHSEDIILNDYNSSDQVSVMQKREDEVETIFIDKRKIEAFIEVLRKYLES